LTQTVFAYLLDHDGKDFQGDQQRQPLVAWIKFKLNRTGQSDKPLRLWLNQALLLKRNTRMWIPRHKDGGVFFPEINVPYKGTLKKEGRFLLSDDQVRLIVSGDNDWEYHRELQVPEGSKDSRWKTLRKNKLLSNLLQFDLKPSEGDELVLAFPFSAVSRNVVRRISAIGPHKARAEMIDYWHKRIASENMTVRVPEKEISDLYQAGTIGTLTGLDLENSRLLVRGGMFSYEGVWTLCSTLNIWQLDLQGFHDEAYELLELWRLNRLKITEDNKEFAEEELGPNFIKMGRQGRLNGFFMLPFEFGGIRWACDHGGVMHAAAEHYLLTRDEDYLSQWLPVMLEGCRWIRDARRWTDHDGYPGLTPPLRSTDLGGFCQTTWGEGWNYWGLRSVCRVLREINHPEAETWEKELADYRATILRHLKQAVEKCPTWTTASGVGTSFVPWNFGKHQIDNHGFYVDAGPVFLIASGVLDAHSPVAQER